MSTNEFEYPTIQELQKEHNVADYFSVNEFILEIPYVFDVEIKVRYDRKQEVRFFDLNTGAKSEALVPVNPDRSHDVIAYLRYNDTYEINDMTDVLYMVLYCMLGKPSVDEKWKKALAHYGLIQVKLKEEIVFPR